MTRAMSIVRETNSGACADAEALGQSPAWRPDRVGDVEIELVLEELGLAAPLGAQSSPNARWSTSSRVWRMRHPR
jgi:hypothetical protein